MRVVCPGFSSVGGAKELAPSRNPGVLFIYTLDGFQISFDRQFLPVPRLPTVSGVKNLIDNSQPPCVFVGPRNIYGVN